MNHLMREPFAFPRYSECDGQGSSTKGLSKRELFAAMALQGMLASECANYNYGAASDRHHLMAISAVSQKDGKL